MSTTSSTRTKVAFLTQAPKPEITPDDALALPALVEAGFEVRGVAWDDPAVDWSPYAAVVVRSPWNYWRTPDTFLEWLAAREAAGIRVLNSPATLRWNLNKRYLMGLYEKGVAIPKTIWLKRGSRVVIDDWLAVKNIHQAVVKPAISAGGNDTLRLPAAEVQATLDRWLPERDLLVQEFEPAIETQGEISLVYFGGKFSHALVKQPKTGEFRIQEAHGGRTSAYTAPSAWIARGQEILALAPTPLLYARVDCVSSPDGKPLLMELEAIEPALFFKTDPQSPSRFTQALTEFLKAKN